jgi:hypothetical protein
VLCIVSPNHLKVIGRTQDFLQKTWVLNKHGLASAPCPLQQGGILMATVMPPKRFWSEATTKNEGLR